jgi:hypothetical protein
VIKNRLSESKSNCNNRVVIIFRRTRHLLCKQQLCNQVPIAHIAYIHYTHYTFKVDFYNLETFHQKYQVKEVIFYVSVFKTAITLVR